MPISRLSFPGVRGCPDHHLSVDGMTERGPNLSHWPGNRTPAVWKADLSTGICLEFARAPRAEQEAFLAGADTVLNDHYDTDGFGALLAVLRPEVASAHEELLLAAATTGDFGVLGTRRAFAIDRIVAGIAGERSPHARELAGLAPAERSLARYRFLIEHAEPLLSGRLALEAIWADEHAAAAEEVRRARTGALARRSHDALGLAVLTSDAPMRRMTLNTLAAAYRVLHVERTVDGPLYRYHDRTESWFELVTIRPPARHDLRPLAERLRELEARAGHSAGEWFADPPEAPVPELVHGVPTSQEYGDVSRTRTPSALAPDVVEGELVRHFG